MNPQGFQDLVKYLENSPTSLAFEKNIVDLPDSSSIFVGERVYFMDFDRQLVPLTQEQQDILRTIIAYCRAKSMLEKLA